MYPKIRAPFMGWVGSTFLFKASTGYECKATTRGPREVALREIAPSVRRWYSVAAGRPDAKVIETFARENGIDLTIAEEPVDATRAAVNFGADPHGGRRPGGAGRRDVADEAVRP